ncbi:MAG: radical SAM protein [Acidobacteriota bacterium]|nr:radical SAM protein [Acidobacteriota bacterium]
MLYEGTIYRPPSEADALILQATVGCSWNACTYCDMYRAKDFRVRPLAESLEHLDQVAAQAGVDITKIFVADGDALAMDLGHWLPILERCRASFPRLRRVSCYATARNILEKSPEEMTRLRDAGLSLLYVGPESGDDVTMKRIAKGATHDQHVEAARSAHDAGMRLSTIFLLGAGGVERSVPHAQESARLAGAMDPRFVSLLTLTVVPGTPIAELERRGKFVLPGLEGLLEELYAFIDIARPTDAIFRTNHASNYLPLSGRLPRDRERLLAVLDGAREGAVPLRPEWLRGL